MSQCEYWMGRRRLTGEETSTPGTISVAQVTPRNQLPISFFFFNRAFQRQGMSPRKASFLQLLANARGWKF
jgi:hypothetical protein